MNLADNKIENLSKIIFAEPLVNLEEFDVSGNQIK